MEKMEVIIDQEKLFNNASCDERKYGEGATLFQTACMRHYKDLYNEKCYELETLKLFIDGYLSKDMNDRYRKLSPMIIRAMKDNIYMEAIYYEYIYETVVDFCVEKIDCGNYKLAEERIEQSLDAFEQVLNLGVSKK